MIGIVIAICIVLYISNPPVACISTNAIGDVLAVPVWGRRSLMLKACSTIEVRKIVTTTEASVMRSIQSSKCVKLPANAACPRTNIVNVHAGIA